MSRTVTAMAAALAALALTAPAASADHEFVDCDFFGVAQPGTDKYDGYASGYVVAPGDTVSIRCEVRVDGVVAYSTPTGTGNSVATTADVMSFVAEADQYVEFCAVYTTSHGERQCEPIGPEPWPPLVIWDTISRLLYAGDPVICEGLKAMRPGAGPVFINEQGDVYVDGEPQWDCPPYDIWPTR